MECVWGLCTLTHTQPLKCEKWRAILHGKITCRGWSCKVDSEWWEENRQWHQIRSKTSPLWDSVFLCKMRGLDWISDRKYISLIAHTFLEGFGEKASEGRSCLSGNVSESVPEWWVLSSTGMGRESDDYLHGRGCERGEWKQLATLHWVFELDYFEENFKVWHSMVRQKPTPYFS